uniref:Ig-like domain-containing protein n=1 Tax=Strix occidentalis caurina TaxID=311401 RepID=A0A8D0FDY9_STROC
MSHTSFPCSGSSSMAPTPAPSCSTTEGLTTPPSTSCLREASVPFPEPVSRPQLWSSGLVAQATGELLCDVAEGKVDTITWKKDGQPLPLDRDFHLSDSLSILYLRPAKKSDCGSYSCNASNGIRQAVSHPEEGVGAGAGWRGVHSSHPTLLWVSRGRAVEMAQRLHLRAGVHRLHPGRHCWDPLDARGR